MDDDDRRTLVLRRYHYGRQETLGWLSRPGSPVVLHTIEQPWRQDPGGALGGQPSRSCVPDGRYRLIGYPSQRHGDTWGLEAPDLGVYVRQTDREAAGGGRWGCILHAGNTADDVQGCIAVGRRRAARLAGQTVVMRVLDSQPAMQDLRDARVAYDTLRIVPVMGAGDVLRV